LFGGFPTPAAYPGTTQGAAEARLVDIAVEAGHAEDVCAGHPDWLYQDGQADRTHHFRQVYIVPSTCL